MSSLCTTTVYCTVIFTFLVLSEKSAFVHKVDSKEILKRFCSTIATHSTSGIFWARNPCHGRARRCHKLRRKPAKMLELYAALIINIPSYFMGKLVLTRKIVEQNFKRQCFCFQTYIVLLTFM